MLLELQLENFILIKREAVPFGNGLNIVSGASGAGKTILVKALGLLSGERASSDLIGPFGKKAILEGFFRIDPARLARTLKDAVPDADDGSGELVALRTLDVSGDNRCYLNGRAVTLQSFRRVLAPLLEISGQESLPVLASSTIRAAMLDRYARCEELTTRFAAALKEGRGCEERLVSLREGASERRDKIDLLSFQIAEINRLDLSPGEVAAVEEEHRLLNSLEQVEETFASGRQNLYESDDSVADRIGAVLRSLEALPAFGEGRIGDCADALRKALASVEDAAFVMRDLQAGLSADPERLAEVERRLSDIHGTLLRYGPTEADFFEFLARIESDFAAVNISDDDLEALDADLAEKKKTVVALGKKLNRARSKASLQLASEVNATLGRLQMKEILFSIDLRKPDWEEILRTASAAGPGTVRFLVATNPGTGPAPVERIASGGERSRILLALLSALGKCSDRPAMIFDEIDENVGARLGGVVGDILLSLSEDLQVVAITHLSSIAARGALHNKVEKKLSKKGVTIRVRKLTGEARALEIAEMAVGPSPPPEAVKQALRELNEAETN
jgi:DNA repair protein RecN (Recombination protein N)